MGIVAYFTNNYGTYQLPSDGSVMHLHAPNGSLAANINNSAPGAYHYRTGYTTNPIVRLGYKGTPWRSKSSYSRGGSEWIRTIGNYKSSYGSPPYYFKDSTILQSAVVSLYASHNPDFVGINGSYTTASPRKVDVSGRSVTKALSDLASKKAGMGENLIQASSTISSIAMVVQDAIKVLQALNGLRRGRIPNLTSLNVRSLRRLVKSRKIDKRAANYWLAYYYGFKPLVGDVEGLVELLKEYADPPALLVHGRGSGDSDKADTWSVSNNGAGLFAPQSGLDFEEFSRIKARTTITGRMSDQLLRNLNRTGLLPTPALAWELIPFSFVVDWFVPVGSLLEGLSATSGLVFVDGSTTITSDRRVISKVKASDIISGEPMTDYRRSDMVRTRLSNWPRPQLFDKPFYSGNDRLATIAALISNLTRR